MDVKTVVNLCPHALNIIAEDGSIRDFPKCENPARVSQSEEVVGNILGVQITKQKFGKVENLPEPQEATYLIVSRLVVSAAQAEGRDVSDLLIPGPGVRNEIGQIVGAKGFSIL